jgi:hypothetical protein
MGKIIDRVRQRGRRRDYIRLEQMRLEDMILRYNGLAKLGQIIITACEPKATARWWRFWK